MRRLPAVALLLVVALLAGWGVLSLAGGLDDGVPDPTGPTAGADPQELEDELLAPPDRARDAAVRWLRAWQARDYAAVDAVTAEPDAPGDALRRTDQRLQVVRSSLVPGELSAAGDSVPYTGTAELAGLGTFRWSSRVRVAPAPGGYAVVFDARTVHPDLVNGTRLDRQPLPVRGELQDRRGRAVRGASADLAVNVLGQPATTTRAASGLERVLADRVVGRSGTQVVIANPVTGEGLRVVQRFGGAAPAPVRTSLDLDVQRAAERALAGLSSPAALVAVDSATGQVRAVASRPISGKPRAFTSFAPGSVFKVITTAAALESGLRPGSAVDCPDSYRGTRNAVSVRPGPSTLSQALVQSCNTAFLRLAEELPDGALARTAARFGFGQDLLPIKTDPGSFPTGGASADATAAIGQGRVEASPLLLATVLAAVESGTWRRPTLLAGETGAGTALAPGVAPALRRMLRTAVSSGPGGAADVAGPPVSGKTGSAQVGTGGQVHAWFAGYRDGLAFCVFVESGASGSRTAAPVAARFLRGL